MNTAGPSAGCVDRSHKVSVSQCEIYSSHLSGQFSFTNFNFIGVPQLGLSKFGPWGGEGGVPQDIETPPYRLESITINSGVIINSIEFSYTGYDGIYHTSGHWGGHGGNNNLVSVKGITLLSYSNFNDVI
jgi:hypothetical protein